MEVTYKRQLKTKGELCFLTLLRVCEKMAILVPRALVFLVKW